MNAAPTTAFVDNCLKRLAAGDAAARDDLIARAGDRLTRLAHRMLRGFPTVRGRADTDDVRQDVALRLLSALAAVPPGDALGFFRLASHHTRLTLLDLARRFNGPHAPVTPAEVEAVDSTDGPATLAEWAEFHRQVEALPDDERAAFDLLWYQGLQQAEAAELLALPLRSLQRTWRSARVRLQRQLGTGPGG